MRTSVFIILFMLFGQLNAQTKLPQTIRISSGQCGSPCGYDQGFHDIVFDRQLEYRLTDGSFRYRKNLSKKFKPLNVKPSPVFTDTTTYSSLDSLFEVFPDFKANPGKYFIYRIELEYFIADTGLPLKKKTMDFWVSTDPEITDPKFMGRLLAEYQMTIYKNAL